jgi:hypothetical protein
MIFNYLNFWEEAKKIYLKIYDFQISQFLGRGKKNVIENL